MKNSNSICGVANCSCTNCNSDCLCTNCNGASCDCATSGADAC